MFTTIYLSSGRLCRGQGLDIRSRIRGMGETGYKESWQYIFKGSGDGDARFYEQGSLQEQSLNHAQEKRNQI